MYEYTRHPYIQHMSSKTQYLIGGLDIMLYNAIVKRSQYEAPQTGAAIQAHMRFNRALENCINDNVSEESTFAECLSAVAEFLQDNPYITGSKEDLFAEIFWDLIYYQGDV